VLGPKYGKRLSEIRELLAKEDPASVADRVNAGSTVDLATADGIVQLESSEILVDLMKRAGFAASQGPLATVVLDTAITAELIQEGIARDFVRGVQDARKNAGYRIEDRIVVQYSADPEIETAIALFGEYVRAEVLADDLTGNGVVGASDQVDPEATEGPGGVVDANGSYIDQIEVGQHHVRINLRRSGQ
jgi:isoleucyl-tRNA synthetase